jgi:hypothetical protein
MMIEAKEIRRRSLARFGDLEGYAGANFVQGPDDGGEPVAVLCALRFCCVASSMMRTWYHESIKLLDPILSPWVFVTA